MSGKKDGIEQGYHGLHSGGMGNDGGAAGSHESTRSNTKQARQINTGHPKELERFHKGEGIDKNQ